MGISPGLGSIFSIFGDIAGGQSQASALKYQAAVAHNNSIIAKQNAEYSVEAGGVKAEATGLKARNDLGRVRGALAANGLDVNSGSAADVQVSQREIGALDQNTVTNNAALEAYGYKTQATNYDAQAGLDRREASNALTEGWMKGIGTLLGSGPDMPFNSQWMSQPGGGASMEDIFGGGGSGTEVAAVDAAAV